MLQKSIAARIYNSRYEVEKMLSTIKGMLDGIVCDGEVNIKELTELHAWCEREAQQAVRAELAELFEAINELLECDAENRLELIEDIRWMVDQMRGQWKTNDELSSRIQVLQGIFHGILSDGVVNDKEVFLLNRWLLQNGDLWKHYPFSALDALIRDILRDGKVDEEEREQLKAFMADFVDMAASQPEKKTGGVYDDLPEDFRIQARDFVMTGESSHLDRAWLGEYVVAQGGSYSERVTKRTNYLVVGGLGSHVWVFSRYGRKIETAIKYRQAGLDVKILRDEEVARVVTRKHLSLPHQ